MRQLEARSPPGARDLLGCERAAHCASLAIITTPGAEPATRGLDCGIAAFTVKDGPLVGRRWDWDFGFGDLARRPAFVNPVKSGTDADQPAPAPLPTSIAPTNDGARPTTTTMATPPNSLASRILNSIVGAPKSRTILARRGQRRNDDDGGNSDGDGDCDGVDLRDFYGAMRHDPSPSIETELSESAANRQSAGSSSRSSVLVNFHDRQRSRHDINPYGVGFETSISPYSVSEAGTSIAQLGASPAPAPPATDELVHYYVCMPSGGLEPVTEEQAGARALRNVPGGSGGGDREDNDDEDDDCRSGASSQRSGTTSGLGDLHVISELLHFARNRNWKKKVLTLFIVVTSIIVFYDLLFLGHIRSWISSALAWMTLNPFGAVFSFILFFVVATLLFVPPAILMFGAGYAFSNINNSFLYGFLTSSVVSFVGCVLGAIAAFLRSRYMMRDLIELFSRRYPIVKALDRALERKGFRVMLLLRLCPIVPFNGLNHIGGVMNVSLENYTMALVGIIPTILLWCFCGASADHAMRVRVEEDGPQYMYAIIVFSSGLGFGLIAAVLIWRFAIQELRKEIDQDSAETWFRYKRRTKRGAGSECGESGDGHEVLPVEAGHEMTLKEHQDATAPIKPRRGMLAFLRIDAEDYGLDSYYDGRDDGTDAEWYWLWA